VHITYLKFLLVFVLVGNQSFCQKPIDTSEKIIIGRIKQYIRL